MAEFNSRRQLLTSILQYYSSNITFDFAEYSPASNFRQRNLNSHAVITWHPFHYTQSPLCISSPSYTQELSHASSSGYRHGHSNASFASVFVGRQHCGGLGSAHAFAMWPGGLFGTMISYQASKHQQSNRFSTNVPYNSSECSLEVVEMQRHTSI